jgi:hypothetical protein
MSVTQLGRFGDFASRLKNHPYDDPDQQIAHLYAVNGLIQYGPNPGSRPSVPDVLATKGIWDHRDPTWASWRRDFDAIQSSHLGGLRPLQAQCTTLQPGSRNQCWHELIPPLEHYNLRGFVQHVLPNLHNNNIAQRISDNTLFIYTDSKPLWNFVITVEGDILLSQEDYGVIKHSSLSGDGGRGVWSAGQVGIYNRKIRLVDLRSGHFTRPILPHRPLLQALKGFTKQVFLSYEVGLLGPQHTYLDPQFDCVWS